MEPTRGFGLVIAIVDDEECVRKALERLLRSVGHKVASFHSGEDFLYALGTCQPDCAILDLHLPGLSGLEIQQYFTRNGIGLPCIIMTGRDEPRIREQIFASGANGYLIKPFDQRALLNVIYAAVQATNWDAQEYMERFSCSTRGASRTCGSRVKVREEVFGGLDK